MQIVREEAVQAMRKVLRGLVVAVVDDGEKEKLSASLDGIADDARLAAIAQEALANLKRVKEQHDKAMGAMGEIKKALEDARAELASETRAIDLLEKMKRERDDIAAKYKELQKQIDPERRQLEIMYAIDEATAAAKEETTALRRELGQRQTEVNELRASKKRLREALDRLAGKD